MAEGQRRFFQCRAKESRDDLSIGRQLFAFAAFNRCPGRHRIEIFLDRPSVIDQYYIATRNAYVIDDLTVRRRAEHGNAKRKSKRVIDTPRDFNYRLSIQRIDAVFNAREPYCLAMKAISVGVIIALRAGLLFEDQNITRSQIELWCVS